MIARIFQRFSWPGLNSAVRRWVKVCRPNGGKKFPLKIILSGSFNEIVQIDHQKIFQTKSGYAGILVNLIIIRNTWK